MDSKFCAGSKEESIHEDYRISSGYRILGSMDVDNRGEGNRIFQDCKRKDGMQTDSTDE